MTVRRLNRVVGDAMLPGAMPTDHWFFLSGVEVRRCGGAKGVVAFGDSITDGVGATAGAKTITTKR